MAEIIVAAFDTETHADEAVRDLERGGIASTAIKRFRADEAGAMGLKPTAPTTTTTTTETTTGEHRGGFMSWLLGDEHQPSHSAYEDRELYEEHFGAGRCIVRVEAMSREQAAEITRILGAHMPEEMDSQSTGTTATSAATTAGTGAMGTAAGLGTAHATGTPATEPLATERRGVGVGGRTEREEVIPLAEEHLQVGKEQVRRTRRLRTYVVETPVEETVNLREERTVIDRRAATGNKTVPTGAFEEREVVVEELVEKPVVSKTAELTGEVVVSRETGERTETVRDTVRRTEVEEEGTNATSGTTRTDGRTAAQKVKDAVTGGTTTETPAQRAEEAAERRNEAAGTVYPPATTEDERRLEREREAKRAADRM